MFFICMNVMNLEHVFRNVIPRRLAEMQHITDVPAVFIFICTRLNGVTSQNTIMFFIQHVLITVTYTLPVVHYVEPYPLRKVQ